MLAVTVVAVLAGLSWLLWPTAGVSGTPVQATVVERADCGGAERDVVRFRDDGRSVRAGLDGCGRRVGEQIMIEVPGSGAYDGMTVALAGTGVPAGALTAQRVASVLLAVAGAAGALLVWRVVRLRSPG